MPDWVVLLVAAFGGGLAGAVLQPVVTYAMQRLRSVEEIRRRRDQQLRRMVVGQMDRGRRLTQAWHAILNQHLEKDAPIPFHQRYNIVNQAEGAPLWEPNRIRDDGLQKMACEYFTAAEELRDLLVEGTFLDSNEPPNEPLKRAQRLETLQPQVTDRMDQLNWPEVDD